MPIKPVKTCWEEGLKLERVLYARRHVLHVDFARCYGCDLCVLACPKEALKQVPPQVEEGRLVRRGRVDIDSDKCSLCGACVLMCPFGAFKLEVDGEPAIPVLRSGSYPELVKKVEVDGALCDPSCTLCQDVCPLEAIKVVGTRKRLKVDVERCNGCRSCVELCSALSMDEGRVRVDEGSCDGCGACLNVCEVGALSLEEIVEVKVDLAKCPGCGLCAVICPSQAVRVEKPIKGYLELDPSKCPEGCRCCLDACPVLAIYEEDGSLSVDPSLCVYCKACVYACPVEGALKVVRTELLHTDVKSGAWNRALAKLVSPAYVSGELRARAMGKVAQVLTETYGPT